MSNRIPRVPSIVSRIATGAAGAGLVAAALFMAACGGPGTTSASASASAAAPPKTSAAATASAVAPTAAALPDGIVPVGKLVEWVKANPKGATKQAVQAEGTYWGMSTETTGDQKTYVLEVVASPDAPDQKALCRSSEEPKDLPQADNEAQAKKITLILQGKLAVSGSGRPSIEECKYQKK